jgi:hypothetical protein
LRPALLFGLLLASADYAMDIVMDYFGTSASKTILNDLAIGILGAAAVFFFLTARCQKCGFEKAKERIRLIGDLNCRIRGALEAVAQSPMSEDRVARLESLDEATNRIDTILCDFIARPASGRRLSLLPKRKKAPEVRVAQPSGLCLQSAVPETRNAGVFPGCGAWHFRKGQAVSGSGR